VTDAARFCSGCAAGLGAGVRFCPSCGARVVAGTTAPAVDVEGREAAVLAELGQRFREASGRSVERHARAMLEGLARDQLELAAHALDTPEARALVAQARHVDEAAGSPIVKGFQALRAVFQQRRQGQ